MKRHLHVLIYVFTLLTLASGCAQHQPVADAVEVFSPEYYILKKPAQSDMDRLYSFNTSKNRGTQASAGLIIGYNYMRNGEFVKAEEYLQKYYNDNALSPYMKSMGQLWMMELSLAKGDIDSAEKQAQVIKKNKSHGDGVSALDTYCITMKLYPKDGEDAYGCVVSRLDQYKKDVASDGVNAPYLLDEFTSGASEEWTKKENEYNILVYGSADMQDISGGVYYYTSKNGLKHKIKLSRTFIDGDWDFILDLDRGYLGARGFGVYFTPEIGPVLAHLDTYLDLKCKNVIIGAGSNLRDSADMLRGRLEKAGNSVHVADITDSRVAREVRDYLGKVDKDPFCAVGAGSEDEINNFIPNVKQFAFDPKKQRIYYIVDIDTGKQRTGNYRSYYLNTTVVPVIDLTLGDGMKEFDEEYYNFSGRHVSYTALLGYDMIHFINTRTMNPKELADPYMTHITSIDGTHVERSVRAFYINDQGVAVQVMTSDDNNIKHAEGNDASGIGHTE